MDKLKRGNSEKAYDQIENMSPPNHNRMNSTGQRIREPDLEDYEYFQNEVNSNDIER